MRACHRPSWPFVVSRRPIALEWPIALIALEWPIALIALEWPIALERPVSAEASRATEQH